MKFYHLLWIALFFAQPNFAQTKLTVPPLLRGTSFDLNIQNGTHEFYPGIKTPTFGVNGDILGPTLEIRKGEMVTMNVTNSLKGNGNSTTIHWHGLHLPAIADGGPHQVIKQGETWRPKFEVMNNAGTFWYHPHGEGKTDLHVSKGIAGFIIVRDEAEAAITLPRQYGVDDFPIVIQTKNFDVLNQIAIATELDTAVCVNGAILPTLTAPAQVIRLRVLNGSSMRTYNIGLSGNHSFSMIATDGGLIEKPLALTRLILSPGERAEILIDLQKDEGTTIQLKSYSSEFRNGIYGAKTVTGMMGGTIPDYDQNPLNGLDFTLMNIAISVQTSSPITSIPNSLISQPVIPAFTKSRNLEFLPDTLMSGRNQVEGPFNIDGKHFDMERIDHVVVLGTTEKWRITNTTGIAHPFHIHDVQFQILNVNGGAVPTTERGWKDVVLVLPRQYVEFVTTFSDFADDKVPYMFHCHMLHHEDDGMMGSFIVRDTAATDVAEEGAPLMLYPNPASEILQLTFPNSHVELRSVKVINSLGVVVLEKDFENFALGDRSSIDVRYLASGAYRIVLCTSAGEVDRVFVKE